MKAFFNRMAMNRFVVLGRVGMDLYADPPGTKAEEAVQFFAALGGSAGNIAAGLARLGSQVQMLTRVSDDAVGRFCLNQLARYGVGSDMVAVAETGRRTSLAVTETRIEACQTVLYRNGAADFDLRLGDVAVEFGGIAALVVTGTALAADPSRSATFAAMQAARKAGAVVVLDLDYRAYSWVDEAEAAEVCLRAASLTDVLVGNDEEFAILAGGRAEGLEYARNFPHRFGRFAIYKRGEAGSATFGPDYSFDTPIFPVAAIKPMGAGDAFLAGVLSSLATGHGIEAAVRRGSAAAAIVVSGIGCAPASPDLETLNTFIAERGSHAHRTV